EAALVARTAGAATQPAPAPDGSIYFMSLERDGFVVRHLADVKTSPPRVAPPTRKAGTTFQAESLAPAREYGFGHQEFASVFGGSWTAYDRNDEVGVRMGDVVGRLDALAIASSEGSAVAVAWRGWPVAVTAHAIRHGLELRGNYDIHGPLPLLHSDAG